jgi:hypothetical protein
MLFLAAQFFGLELSAAETDSRSQPKPEGLSPVGSEPRGNRQQAPLTTEFARTLLLSKSLPSNLGSDPETVMALRRMQSVVELEAALQQDIRLLVVDRSSLEDLEGSDILQRQLREGRSIIGLNISNAELRAVSGYTRLVDEMRVDRNGPPLPEIRSPSIPSQAFYSILLASLEGPIGGYQKYFFEGLFKNDLLKLDQGAWREEPASLVNIADLPEERISINRGMGCIYDEAKTAAVAKRELVASYPDAEVFAVTVLYCNPDPTGTVVLGALLLQKREPFTYTPPAGCVDATGRPLSEPQCFPPPRTESPGVLVRIEVPVPEVTP